MTFSLVFDHAGELQTRNVGRLRAAGIESAGHHGIGKVHPYGFHPYHHFSGLGLGIGNVLQFEDFGTAAARARMAFISTG